jgi:signal transduction histidine kinase
VPQPESPARAGFAALDAVGLRTPFRRDCALALAVALASVALVVLTNEVESGSVPSATAGGLLVAQAVALCLRRVHPLLCAALVIALQAVLAAVVPAGQGIRGLALVVVVYTCGVVFPARRALVLAGVAALSEVVEPVLLGVVAAPAVVLGNVVGQLLVALLLYPGAALLGGYTAMRRRYVDAALAAQDARADSALAAERARMARELHDVAAHHLTALIVQATLVERLVDRDPEAARHGAADIRNEGKQTLRNLRLIVGALREPDLPDGGAPVPGLAALDRLLDGDPRRPELRVRGEPGPWLTPAADLTFYRVAQQALTNARDHAPGAPAVVTVVHRPDATVLEVRNQRPAAPAPPPERGAPRGFGLAGMRERAALVGAELVTGPTADGGWRVRLILHRPEGDTTT